MNYKNILKIFIGILIIILILYNLNLKILIDIISGLDIRWIFIAGILFFIAHLLIIYRLKYILNKFYKIPYGKLFWFHFFGYSIGQFTPGKVGYLSLTYLFKKEKIPYSLSSSILILAQVMSLIVQVIFASFGLLYLILLKSVDISGIIFIILALGWIFFLSIAILLFFRFGASKLKFIKKLPYGEKMFKLLESVDRNFSKVKSMLPAIFIMTVFMWVLSGLSWAAIGASLGINLPYPSYILLNPLITSLTFVPISPSGIGFAEVGSVLVLSLLGVQPERGFILMILDRSINLLIGLLGLKIIFSKK